MEMMKSSPSRVRARCDCCQDSFRGVLLLFCGVGRTRCGFDCFTKLKSGGRVTKTTEMWDTHSHEVRIRINHENTLVVDFVGCQVGDGTL